MDILFIVMAFGDLLNLSWDILNFVVERIWIICLLIFMFIMIKTAFDISKNLVKIAKPGYKKLLRKW